MPILLVGQYKVILLSLFFGAILGLIYELYSFLGCILGFREGKEGKNVSKIKFFLVFVWDFLYFIVIAPICAIFLYGVNLGRVRWYILLCWLIGFVLYKATLGLILTRILNCFSSIIKKGVYSIANKLKNILKKLHICRRKTKKKNGEKREVFSFGIKNNRA